MKNLKSAFCWNICGMIAKLNKKEAVAARNFTQALKYDPENHQILREATNLYLFSKDFQMHEDFRKKMLFQKPKIMLNWPGFIAGYFLVNFF